MKKPIPYLEQQKKTIFFYRNLSNKKKNHFFLQKLEQQKKTIFFYRNLSNKKKPFFFTEIRDFSSKVPKICFYPSQQKKKPFFFQKYEISVQKYQKLTIFSETLIEMIWEAGDGRVRCVRKSGAMKTKKWRGRRSREEDERARESKEEAEMWV